MATLQKNISLSVFALLSSSGAALAHAAEGGFVLLLPTQAYITGGAVAVLASIILVTCLSSTLLARLFRPIPLGNGRNRDRLQTVTSTASSAFFAVLVYIGLYGPNDPLSNLMPLTIWTVWWVGLYAAQGLFGDLWKWINPWTGLYRLVSNDAAPVLRLPAGLHVWPACLIFFGFQGFIMADIAPNDPERLTLIAASYWLFTFVGMVLFGPKQWLSQVECFSVLFRLIGSLRAYHSGPPSRIGCPGWASIEQAPLHISHAFLCLSILASGSFDGVHETFWWLGKIGVNPLEFPGRSAVVWQSTLGLIAANILLIAIFALSVFVGTTLVARLTPSGKVPFGLAFNTFAISILPIAFGYHLAHYLVSFLVQIQYVASTLGDPLARGWNLFGLSSIRVTTGFLNTAGTVKIIWLSQAAIVVLSHVLSVLMTHHLATRFCARNRDIVALQIGLSVLMILYTIFGLWLLASPRGV